MVPTSYNHARIFWLSQIRTVLSILIALNVRDVIVCVIRWVVWSSGSWWTRSWSIIRGSTANFHWRLFLRTCNRGWIYLTLHLDLLRLQYLLSLKLWDLIHLLELVNLLLLGGRKVLLMRGLTLRRHWLLLWVASYFASRRVPVVVVTVVHSWLLSYSSRLRNIAHLLAQLMMLQLWLLLLLLLLSMHIGEVLIQLINDTFRWSILSRRYFSRWLLGCTSQWLVGALGSWKGASMVVTEARNACRPCRFHILVWISISFDVGDRFISGIISRLVHLMLLLIEILVLNDFLLLWIQIAAILITNGRLLHMTLGQVKLLLWVLFQRLGHLWTRLLGLVTMRLLYLSRFTSSELLQYFLLNLNGWATAMFI